MKDYAHQDLHKPAKHENAKMLAVIVSLIFIYALVVYAFYQASLIHPELAQ